MACTNKLSRTSKIFYGLAIGASSVGGLTWLIVNKRNKRLEHNISPGIIPINKVLASWTTNTLPTARWDDNWDRMQPEFLVKPSKRDATSKASRDCNVEKGDGDARAVEVKLKPTATRHLFLIRHGQYVLNSPEDSCRKLTPLGIDQAHVTAARLVELHLPYTRIVHSTMLRARETSSYIEKQLPDVPVSECELLREGAPMPPEPPGGTWRPEADQFFKDGARIEAAFRKYFHRAPLTQKEDSYEVIVCHANVIRYFVCRALQFPPEGWLRMSLHNGSITWVTIRPSGRVSLKTLGDCGHFKPALLSTT